MSYALGTKITLDRFYAWSHWLTLLHSTNCSHLKLADRLLIRHSTHSQPIKYLNIWMGYSNVSLLFNQQRVPSVMSTSETMHIQYTFIGVRGHRIARHSAGNIGMIKNPFLLLQEQGNSRAPLIGLIKMAAAAIYQQPSIDKRLQPIYTPKKKKKLVNTNRCALVNVWK